MQRSRRSARTAECRSCSTGTFGGFGSRSKRSRSRRRRRGRAGRPRHRRRAARSRPAALPHRPAARRDGRKPAGRARGAPRARVSLCALSMFGAPAPLLAGAKTTSYGEAFAARRLAERDGRGRGAPRRGRPRPGSRDREHLVAPRRRAAHAGRAARRSARRDARARPRAGGRDGGALPADRARRSRRGVPHLVDPRGDARRRAGRQAGRQRCAGPGRGAVAGRAAATLHGGERYRPARWHGACERRPRARPAGLGVRRADRRRQSEGRRAPQAPSCGLGPKSPAARAGAARRGVRAAPAGEARPCPRRGSRWRARLRSRPWSAAPSC